MPGRVDALLAAATRAAQQASERVTDLGYESPLPDLVSVAGRMLLVLGVAIVVLLALRWWVRRGGSVGPLAKFGSPALGGEHLRLRESLRLGPDQTIHLVDVAGRTVLLSATAGRVEMLTDLGNAAARTPADGGPEAVSRREFEEVLRGPSPGSPPATENGDVR